MMSRVAREVAPCDQLQLIGDKLHELKRLLPILHFHSLLETVERTPVDPNGSDPELANTSDNGADGVSKPKSYLRLPEIPALVTSCDLRGSKALVLLGYRDCSYETHRYMVEVENLPEDDPLVLGLQQHLEQHWLQMDIHSLLKDGLKEESIEWNSDSTNNLPLSTDISNGTTAFSHIGQDSLDTDGGAQSRDNRKESRKHHLCHRQSLHRRHRHHPHQRSQQNHHHHHHHRQSCSQCQATQRPHLLHEHQSFVKSLSRREELNTRVLRVSEENPSDPQRNGEEKTKTIKFEIQPVTSDILLSPSQSAASSSSSESEPDKAVDSCVQALLTPDNNNSLLVPNSPDNNNDNNNNNNNDDDDLEETSSNNEVSLKEEDPERWKQLNLSIARVTQELIVLLENEGSTLSEDEDEDGYEEEEESDDGGIVGDIDFNNILNQ